MTRKTQRAAIYARVSTDETRQTPETQLRQLREYAAYRGFQIVGEYIDYASGKHTERTATKRLLRWCENAKSMSCSFSTMTASPDLRLNLAFPMLNFSKHSRTFLAHTP